MNKIVVGISAGILAIVAFISFSLFDGEGEEMLDSTIYNYEIIEKWELPSILQEVSAIEYLGGNDIACIQDEKGVIFIYNLKTARIKAQINFHGGGDYEGLAINGRDAYVLRSDGAIFQVKDFQDQNPSVKKYETSLTSLDEIDMEGLCVDEKNERLLIAAKYNSERSEREKLVYAFNLLMGEIEEKPVFKLAMEDPVFEELDEKLENKFSPSEIEIHPSSGKFYFLDGRSPKLLIADPDTGPGKLFELNEQEFSQPEGLTFKPDGTLYISNEGGKGTATIYEVALNN